MRCGRAIVRNAGDHADHVGGWVRSQLRLFRAPFSHTLGLPKVAATLEQLGLESPPTLNPSLLLGTVEMSPLEVVQVYTTLADGGFRTRLRAVRAVLDVRPEAVARGRARLVVGPVRSDAVGEAMWNEGREALQGLH